jgi:hypothetical protein
MRRPRTTTRELIALIAIAALLLALVIQHQRAVRHRAEYEKRLSGDLVELRDLRNRDLKRLEGDYIRLREELRRTNSDA